MTRTRPLTGRRVAVVLFNLGGPEDQATVRPFLFNLFNDPAIIGLPGLLRTPLARLISSRREKTAQANYALMDAGGGSPLLAETEAQAAVLKAVLADWLSGDVVATFIAMRYWRPLTDEAARAVAAFAPDDVVLLPLYPQFSTTTTQSSLKAWKAAYTGSGQVRTVCCYPQADGWIEAQADAVRRGLADAGERPVRVLFSAHGIPEVLVGRGDPYQEQVEATAAAVAARAGVSDWRLCYQSRVGPMKWLGPSTPEAIRQAGEEGLGVVIAPIAFVSEHVETLVELDIDYAELARHAGIAPYIRTATVGVAAPFIQSLAKAAIGALGRPGTAPFGPGCRDPWAACPFQNRSMGKAA